MNISEFIGKVQQYAGEIKSAVTIGVNKLFGKKITAGTNSPTINKISQFHDSSNSITLNPSTGSTIKAATTNAKLPAPIQFISQKISTLFNKIIKNNSNSTLEVKQNLQTELPQTSKHDTLPDSRALKNFTRNLVTTGLQMISARAAEYKKYGSKIIDSQSLLSEATLPKSASEKKELCKNLTNFISKGLANEWGIEGEVVIDRESVKLNGQQQDISHMRLAASMERYLSANSSNPKLLEAGLSKANQQKLQECLQKSPQYLEGSLSAKEALEDLQKGLPVTLGVGWAGHAVEVTICDGYLFYTNRSSVDRLGNNPGNMMRYKINGPITEEFINKLCSVNDRYVASKRNDRMNWLEGSGPNTMASELGLKLVEVIEKGSQKTGNCNWANGKGGVYASMLMLIKKEIQTNGREIPDEAAFAMAKKSADNVYKDWELTSRHESLNSFLDMEKDVLNHNILLSPKDYYSLISEAGGKIAIKKSYQEGGAAAAAEHLKSELKTKLQNSKIPLSACFQETAIETDTVKVLVSSKPGGFVLRKENDPLKYLINYRNDQGAVVQETITLKKNGSFVIQGESVRTLGELMTKMKVLSTPISTNYVKRILDFPVFNIIKEVIHYDKESTEQYLNGIAPGEVELALYPNRDGYTFCFKLPEFAARAANAHIIENKTRLDESLPGYFERLNSRSIQFKIMQDIGLGFSSLQKAKTALSADPSKTVVIYKNEQGEIFALHRNSIGQPHPIPPKSGFFSFLSKFEAEMQ